MKGVNISYKKFFTHADAEMGIGSLIIFIAMILVAGITASVMLQTMNKLQQQAMKTGEETLREVSSGVTVTQISGYTAGSYITQLAIFLTPTAASEDMDLTYAYVSLSDSNVKVILNYTNTCFSDTVSNGLFGTINASNLTSSTYGVLVIRDTDNSCSVATPTINDRDLVVLLVNTTKCFSGISPRAEIFGNIHPEYGINGVISFTAPGSFVDTIIDLQP
ncbi:MAG: flagellin [Euryarchaeota archaeon]|nr:flagellin [Euryarchaeota archaeon]